MPGIVAHQREAARQHALVGECGEQLVGAIERREAPLDQVRHGTLAALE